MHRRTTRALPAINAGLRPFTPRRDADRLMRRMLSRNGIREESDAEFIDDLRFLLREVTRVDRLSALGWYSFYADIEGRLRNRARVRRIIADNPTITQERIVRPIVVVGLPRTATTLAHRILSAAPGARGPKLWELMHTSTQLSDREARKVIRGVDNAMRMVTALAPAMRDIHPQRAEQSDECAFLLPHGEQHLARAPMPRYETWLKTRDHYESDYQYLKQALQVLQYGREPARWVLKCPTHLGHLSLILKLFPDVMIVWTHRNPVDVVGSICSLVETSRAMHLRHLGEDDLHDIGRMAIATMSSLVERGRNARTSIPRGRIIDLRYPALTADPPGVIENLYGSLDLEWTPADRDRVLAATERRPGRPHEYTLYRYGLDEASVQAAFGDYGNLADPPIFGSSI
ncbi:sulfotransferase [Glycomyces sp. NPDC021274]|uniref:sulfotransferase family protein n=1 Tax=Glycomyces sp. NPDC021274 TaxID=3155120 RepID=UPI003400AA6F